MKTAVRNIVRHKGHSFINITGLAVGMMCCILILLWVRHELSYDKFHENANNLYRVYMKRSYNGGDIYSHLQTPAPLAFALKKDYPGIVNAARLTAVWQKLVLKYGDKVFNERGGCLSDPAVFEMFTFPFVKGESKSALSEPHSIVLTKKTANKYFGNDDPVGKSIKVNNRYDFKVTGVIKNIPSNSHIQFDFLLPFEFFEELENYPLNRWDSNSFVTYILVEKDIPYREVSKKIRGVIKRHLENSTANLYLQPLTRAHLHPISGGGAIKYVRFFTIIALLVLIIACTNFMNLATARSAARSKEVGLRKVAGASRMQLIRQFLGESILSAFIALFFSIILVELFLPVFNHISGKELEPTFLKADLFIGLMGIALITGIVSGSYPALFLSSLKPAAVLKGTMKTSSSLFRKILVVIQFTLSIILIINTIVIYKQLHYIQNKDLGYNRENIVYFEMENDFNRKYRPMKNELLQNPNIINVTATSQMPDSSGDSTLSVDWQGRDPGKKMKFQMYYVDFDYFETFKMKMARGRSFSREFSEDKSNFILNEEAIRRMNMDSPVGKRFTLWGNDGTIVGVVKDFNFNHLQREIEPLLILVKPGRFRNAAARLHPGNVPGTLEYIERVWNKYNPGVPFDYKFFDEDFDRLYSSEQRMGKIFSAFSLLAIFISYLGLFGLTSFLVGQRTKEIGIKKVLGASVPGIVLFLNNEFSKWVLVSNIIAWPIAYYTTAKWLQGFAYRTSIGVLPFILSGIGVMIIALLAVSYRPIRAAAANPVEALRYE